MNLDEIDLKIVNQDIALDSYLSTLLEEIPSNLESEKLEKKQVRTKVEIQEKQLVTKTKVKLKTAVKITKDELIESPQLKKKEQALAVVNPLSVMPDWSMHEFPALFFKIEKLTLAAPLTDLLRTIKIETAPTRIPGQPSWFLGLLDWHEHRIGVLDTGQLIFGKTKGQQRDKEQNPFKSILITQDGKWGLACDEILSIGKLEPEKVRWRTNRQKRPWLIGTAIDELTAIIDISQLVPHRKAG